MKLEDWEKLTDLAEANKQLRQRAGDAEVLLARCRQRAKHWPGTEDQDLRQDISKHLKQWKGE